MRWPKMEPLRIFRSRLHSRSGKPGGQSNPNKWKRRAAKATGQNDWRPLHASAKHPATIIYKKLREAYSRVWCLCHQIMIKGKPPRFGRGSPWSFQPLSKVQIESGRPGKTQVLQRRALLPAVSQHSKASSPCSNPCGFRCV